MSCRARGSQTPPLAIVPDELVLDDTAGQNLATFAEPEARPLMDQCAEKNVIHMDEYPQTAELDTWCVRIPHRDARPVASPPARTPGHH